MKKVYLLICVFMLVACGQMKDKQDIEDEEYGDNGKYPTPVPTSTVTPIPTPEVRVKYSSLKGQVYYDKQDILGSREGNQKTLPFDLNKFTVYLIGRHWAYERDIWYDGRYLFNNIQPDVYQIIIKTSQYSKDQKGEFTYQYIGGVDMQEPMEYEMGMVRPEKVYLDETEEVSADTLLGN